MGRTGGTVGMVVNPMWRGPGKKISLSPIILYCTSILKMGPI